MLPIQKKGFMFWHRKLAIITKSPGRANGLTVNLFDPNSGDNRTGIHIVIISFHLNQSIISFQHCKEPMWASLSTARSFSRGKWWTSSLWVLPADFSIQCGSASVFAQGSGSNDGNKRVTRDIFHRNCPRFYSSFCRKREPGFVLSFLRVKMTGRCLNIGPRSFANSGIIRCIEKNNRLARAVAIRRDVMDFAKPPWRNVSCDERTTRERITHN